MVEVFNYKTHIFDVEMNDMLSVRAVGDVYKKALMPVCLRNNCSAEAVEKWIRGRLIPAGRIGEAQTAKLFPQTARPHNMFSLSDQYWFRWDSHETWEKGNFFTNGFHTEYGRMYFSPDTVNVKTLAKQESPDMTTNGILKKRWIQGTDGKGRLIKMGDRGAHQDPISEVLSSMILEKLDLIPFVRYELVADGMKFCSSCENFVGVGEEFIPAGDYYFLERKGEKEDRLTHLLRMFEKYAPELLGVEDYLERMASADYFIGNNDRHVYNFGVIRDCRTGELKGFAPLFDSGSVFFGNANQDGRKAKIFTDRQVEDAVTKVLKTVPEDLTKRMVSDDMIRFIECYPMLTEKEKEAIVGRLRVLSDDICGRLGKNRQESRVSGQETIDHPVRKKEGI